MKEAPVAVAGAGSQASDAATTKVAAVVPTFNRKQLLIQCLDALFAQSRPVDHVFVIDNASTDGTPELVEASGYARDARVSVVRLPINTGGAGGFSEGARRAHQAGYTWVWLMDDDAEPVHDCLERLLLKADEAVGALCPLIVGDDDEIQVRHHKRINRWGFERPLSLPQDGEAIEVDSNAFVGPLVPARAFDRVGYPEAGLFIWGDDTEFMWRISKQVGPVLVIPAAEIRHRERRAAPGGKLAPWRQCYYVRNAAWSRRRHGTLAQQWYPFYIALRLMVGRRSGGLRQRMELGRAYLLGLREEVRPEWRP